MAKCTVNHIFLFLIQQLFPLRSNTFAKKIENRKPFLTILKTMFYMNLHGDHILVKVLPSKVEIEPCRIL